MAKAVKLEGIFTPTLVPMDERGNVNETELARFFEWLIQKGVHGLYPNGSTGEFTRLTVEERRRIVQDRLRPENWMVGTMVRIAVTNTAATWLLVKVEVTIPIPVVAIT